MTTIFRDDRDRDLAIVALTNAVADLMRIRMQMGDYDIGTMGVSDTIDRYKYMLNELTQGDEE